MECQIGMRDGERKRFSGALGLVTAFESVIDLCMGSVLLCLFMFS